MRAVVFRERNNTAEAESFKKKTKGPNGKRKGGGESDADGF